VVDELVKGGADVELASKGGFTPLMFAAQQGRTGQHAHPAQGRRQAGCRAAEVRPYGFDRRQRHGASGIG
jgi:hypothetical protein